MTYEDGSFMYSPSSFIHIFQWKAAGGLFFITNILEDNSAWPHCNCDPRHPIQIAQLNTDSLTVIKESVTVIEDRKPDQPETIRFSNFFVFEDRQTGSLRFFMRPEPGNEAYKPGDNIPRDIFEYTISMNAD